MFSVLATDRGFLAAGDELWSSPDGWTWTRVGPMQQVRRVARTPDGYVAVGVDPDSAAASWTSPDGLSWTPVAVPTETPGAGDTVQSGMFDAAVGPGGLVAVGSEGLLATVPIVLYGLFRYLYLLHRHELGGSPARALLTDRPLLVCVVIWLAVAAVVINASH